MDAISPNMPRAAVAARPLARAIALACALGWLALAAGWAGAECPAPPPADVWLISSRQASLADCRRNQSLDVRQLDADGNWQRRELEAPWIEPVLGGRTIIHIHGYNTDVDDAPQHGLWVREQLAKAHPESLPARWIIWSWPSERATGAPLSDLRLKADLAEEHAVFLARWLEQVPPDQRVSLMGHSYGARMATAALHLLAGGTIEELALTEPACGGPSCPVRLALTGAALDDDWLLPDRRHGLALDPAEHVLIVVNPFDAVLKVYPRLWGHRGPLALGSRGLRETPELALLCNRITEWDVGNWVGKGHLSSRYLAVPAVSRGLALFLAPACGPAVATEHPPPLARAKTAGISRRSTRPAPN